MGLAGTPARDWEIFGSTSDQRSASLSGHMVFGTHIQSLQQSLAIKIEHDPTPWWREKPAQY